MQPSAGSKYVEEELLGINAMDEVDSDSVWRLVALKAVELKAMSAFCKTVINQYNIRIQTDFFEAVRKKKYCWRSDHQNTKFSKTCTDQRFWDARVPQNEHKYKKKNKKIKKNKKQLKKRPLLMALRHHSSTPIFWSPVGPEHF